MKYGAKKDIWDAQRVFGGYVVVPTNGDCLYGTRIAVMGCGLAKQAALKYPKLPNALGEALKTHGNQVCLFFQWKLFTFPTKHHWNDKTADLDLICSSARQLAHVVYSSPLVVPSDFVFMPHVGCGAGELPWHQVRPFLAVFLSGLKTEGRLQFVDRHATLDEEVAIEALGRLKGVRV